jgi:hypothetical protein
MLNKETRDKIIDTLVMNDPELPTYYLLPRMMNQPGQASRENAKLIIYNSIAKKYAAMTDEQLMAEILGAKDE